MNQSHYRAVPCSADSCTFQHNDNRNEQRKNERNERERLDGRERENVCGRIAEQQRNRKECRSGSIRKGSKGDRRGIANCGNFRFPCIRGTYRTAESAIHGDVKPTFRRTSRKFPRFSTERTR